MEHPGQSSAEMKHSKAEKIIKISSQNNTVQVGLGIGTCILNSTLLCQKEENRQVNTIQRFNLVLLHDC